MPVTKVENIWKLLAPGIQVQERYFIWSPTHVPNTRSQLNNLFNHLMVLTSLIQLQKGTIFMKGPERYRKSLLNVAHAPLRFSVWAVCLFAATCVVLSSLPHALGVSCTILRSELSSMHIFMAFSISKRYSGPVPSSEACPISVKHTCTRHDLPTNICFA